jgi:hypothetical protein
MAGLFPIIQPNIGIISDEFPLYKEVAWDFEHGQPIWEKGRPVVITGVKAVKVWIWKALKTVRARWEIYTWNFGCEVETLIGQPYSVELKRAEAIRYIRESIEINPYITNISNIRVEFEQGNLSIFISVSTVYGAVDMLVRG